jgi:hypothetical protein
MTSSGRAASSWISFRPVATTVEKFCMRRIVHTSLDVPFLTYITIHVGNFEQTSLMAFIALLEDGLCLVKELPRLDVAEQRQGRGSHGRNMAQLSEDIR